MVKHEIARRGFLRGLVAISALLMAARSLASPAFAAALDAERQGFHTLVGSDALISQWTGRLADEMSIWDTASPLQFWLDLILNFRQLLVAEGWWLRNSRMAYRESSPR